MAQKTCVVDVDVEEGACFLLHDTLHIGHMQKQDLK